MGWTHAICGPCWKRREPNRDPVVLKDAATTVCCFCRELTSEGIFVREDPKKTLCKGKCEH